MAIVKRNYTTTDSLLDELFAGFAPFNVKDSGSRNVPVNITEDGEGFNLEVIAPGIKKEDIKVHFEDNLLSISYEKPKNEESNQSLKKHRQEFALSSFKRSFSIDEKIAVEKINAKYENGILKLYLPKKDEVKLQPKEITIQ